MDGKRKVAVFLLTLKGKISGEVFKRLNEKEQEKILVEIASPAPIDPEDRSTIMDEFVQKMASQGIYATGGIAEAENLLQAAFGSKRAARHMTERLQSTLEERPFSIFNDAETDEVYNFISSESPQTIALVLSNMMPENAGLILQLFPQRKRNQIAARVANMAPMTPEAVDEVERVLKEKFKAASSGTKTTSDGPGILAKILTQVQRDIADGVVDSLGQKDPDTATKIRENMFTFEDIVMVDDMAFRNEIIRLPSVASDLPKALKGASDEARDKFLNNMTDKMKNRMLAQLSDMGPVRASEVQEAQRAILDDVQKLEDAGKIQISREQEEMF